MRWHRLLSPDRIRLEMRTVHVPGGEESLRARQERKEDVLRELVDLLEVSGKISNPSKLFLDLRNRERKATTGIGGGIAIPHVRSRQAKEFVMAMARSTPGIDYGAIDGGRVHLFLAMVSPPYEDRLYLRAYRKIGKIFVQEGVLQRVLGAREPHEIIRILSEAG